MENNNQSNIQNESGIPNMKMDENTSLFLSKKFVNRLFGLIFILLGTIGLVNYGPLGNFIAYAMVYCFGMFIFMVLPLLIILGLFLLIKGQWPKFRVNFTGLGYILLIIFCCLASSYSIEGLKLSTFAETFTTDMASISDGLKIASLTEAPKLHGGFIGYFFSSLFLTGLGNIGTIIFTYLFLLIGAFFVLRVPFMSVSNDIRDYNARNAAKKALNKKAEPVQPKKEEKKQAAPFNPFTETRFENNNQPEPEVKAEKKPEEKKSSFFGIPRKPFNPSEEKPVSPFEKEEAYAKPDPYQSRGQANPFSSNAPVNNSVFSSGVSASQSAPLANDQEADLASSAPTPSPFQQQTPISNPTPASSGDNPYNQRIQNPEDLAYIKNQPEEKTSHEINFTPTLKPAPVVEPKPKPQPKPAPAPAPSSNPTFSSYTPSNKKPADPIDLNAVNASAAPLRYMLPSINSLKDRQDFGKFEQNQAAANSKMPIINDVFRKLNIEAEVESLTIGPSVTRFNIARNPGVRVSAIANQDVQSELSIDLKGDMSVRIEPVVRGRDTIGIEIGNVAPTMVSFKTCYGAVIKSPNAQTDKLLIPLGEDVSSDVIMTSLDDLPHLLIAGTTGSGKSVFIHQIIMTLIMRNYPDELKLILIDPKQVEFVRYSDLPHLYCPIVNNIAFAVSVLKKLVAEMERRFSILARYTCSKIQEYNKLRVNDSTMEALPNIVCVIDEFADMMGQDPKNVESLTQRLAQKARAAGIYLIIATQRPDVKCITGTIKSNIPARIALYLPTGTDSRTILDEGGAETLLGRGDLLARIPSLKSTIRLQSAYVSDDEIREVCTYLKQQGKPVYNQDFLNFSIDDGKGDGNGLGGDSSRKSSGANDELYFEIRHFVIESRIASTSSLQRRFSIGYGRAASIIDALEDEGVVKTVSGNRKEVIAEKDDFESEDGSIGEDNINTGE